MSNYIQKLYRELKFIDDFMFTKIMVNNLEICRRILELFLDIKIKKVVIPEKQKTIEILSNSKGIRLDVYVNDEVGTIYNIEMQTTLSKDLPKRSRYYQGMIDLNLIERGARYKELKRSFVIFICLEDPFNKNLPVYRFENICLQDSTLFLEDEAIKVFVNASGNLDGISSDLAAFLNYLNGIIVSNDLVQMIEKEVIKARKHEEWEVEFMTLFLRDQENLEKGRKEEREAGLKQFIKSMKKILQVEEQVYQAVLDSDHYKDISREEFLEIYYND